MRRPILLDNPPPRPVPSVRWSRFLKSRYLSMGGLAAGGVAAVLGASVALATLMAPAVSARVTASDVSVAATSPVAAKPAVSAGVQYVGEVKQTDRPCEQQTWPYIAAHCLKPASGPRPAAAAKIAVDRADIKTSRAGMPSLAATPPAVPPEQKAEPAPVQPAVVQAAASEVPVPAARPTVRQAMRHDAQPKRSQSATAPRDIRPDAQAEARRAYASDRLPSDRTPSPAVRRIETEYDVPGPFGSTRRVVVIRQQPLHHQAAAFNDER